MLKQNYITFLTVAKEKSIRKASEKLFITPSAIKKQLDQLEFELSIILFKRTVHGMELTDIGKDYYSLLSNTVSSYEAQIKELREKYHLTNKTISILNPFHFIDFSDKINQLLKKSLNSELNVFYYPFIATNNTPIEFFEQLSSYSAGIYLECSKEICKNYTFYPLKKIQLGVLVNINNSLFKNTKATFNDLKGMTVNILYSEYIIGSTTIIQDLSKTCNINLLNSGYVNLLPSLPKEDNQNVYIDICAWPGFSSNWKLIPLENMFVSAGIYYRGS